MTDIGLERLVRGIVMQAAADYKKAYITDPSSYQTKHLEKFFYSKWGQNLLGGADAEKIICVLRLQAKYEEWRKQHKCSYCRRKKYETCIHRSGKHFTAMERGELTCMREEDNDDKRG